MNVIKHKARKNAEIELLEWKIGEDEESWQTFAATMPPLPKPRRSWHQRWWTIVGLALILLLIGSGWLWQRAEVGLAQVEREVETAVEAEFWLSESDARIAPLQTTLAQTPSELAHLQVVDLGKDWAMVETVLKAGERSYRQTRVYRQHEHGWYQATPTVALWGAPATLETEFFVFHYFAHDTEAMREAALTLDRLIPTLAVSYLPNQSLDAKWVVWVSPEQPLADTLQGAASDSAIFVTSPAISLTPTTISEGDLLAQAVMLEVIDSLSKEVVARQIPASWQGSQRAVQLETLLYSLRLWEGDDLPLSALHKPVVQWIYSDLPRGNRALPEFDPALCDLHALWEAAPYLLRVPLFCGDAKQMDRQQLWRYLHNSSGRLADLTLFTAATPAQPFGDLATVVGVATVLDYVATRYGREHIATLVAETAHHSSWESLIRATLGVPLADFEAGWQAHLQNEYGVTLHSPR